MKLLYYQGRTLLYHRGIDDDVITYLSDYLQSFVCFVLAIYLLIRRSKIKKSAHKNGYTVCNDTSISVIIIQLTLSLIGLLGGVTHQFLQKVTIKKFVQKLNSLIILNNLSLNHIKRKFIKKFNSI